MARRTDTTDLAARTERAVARLTQVLRGEAGTRRSIAALLTLRRLDDHGPCRITDLAHAERVAQPTMTGLINRLAVEGLVERIADPADARVVRAAITAAGRRELDTVRVARAQALADRLAALDPEARAAIAAALPALEALHTDDPGRP